MSEAKHWYALYTKPRWEKKVHLSLTEKGLTSYCPLNKVRRQWSDRVKLVEEPLFKSYVFVRIPETDKTTVRFINGVVNFVYWLGKPAVVHERDIERIKRFMNEYEEVELEPLELEPDTKVIIKAGVLMDKEARVIKDMKKRVEVEVESLGWRLVAYVEKGNVERVKLI